jgi:MFS family permease
MRAYLRVLRVPGALRFSTTGIVARLPQAMLGLSLVLLLTGLGHSYAEAGLVTGLYALGQVVAGALVARLVDRFGQSRVVLPLLGLHELAVIGVLLVSLAGGPIIVIAGLAFLTGAFMPQIGSLTRARWVYVLGRRAADPSDAANASGASEVGTALAIESVIEEATFVISPVIVATLVAVVAPAAGTIAAAVLVFTGTGLLLLQRSTEPPVVVHAESNTKGGRVGSAGFISVVAVFLGLGLFFGLVEVGIVAVSKAHHATALSGILLAVWTMGSLTSGVIFGARSWRRSRRRLLLLAGIGIAVGSALIALFAGNLLALGIVLFLAGLATAPTLITGNSLVPDLVAERSRTEAFTWIAVMTSAGFAIGSPIAGVLIDAFGATASLHAAAVAGVLVAAAAACAQPLIRRSALVVAPDAQ